MKKTQTLKGFRDFLPQEKRERSWVQQQMKQAFQCFGFAPVETPTLEYASLLLGKYGQEADKLVYTFEDRGGRSVGLRYDQTVPTARLLGQYQSELPRFFRRYQIQNVFRADKPQSGRYREFTQCDCDIFGTTSSVADAEILAVYYAAFAAVGLAEHLTIEINDRQTLFNAFRPFQTDAVDVFSIIQSIDKLDKLTPDQVKQELTDKGLSNEAADQCLTAVDTMQQSENLAAITAQAQALGVPETALVWNPQIARGLDYYTGLIFEGKIAGYNVGSVGGGGRYDTLISDLSGVDIPAVGFGIGFDRTVEAARTLGTLPSDLGGASVMVCLFAGYEAEALSFTQQLRAAGVATDVYPQPDKIQKQLSYANKQNYACAVLIGESEAAANTIMIKDMQTGEQSSKTTDEALASVVAMLEQKSVQSA